MWISVEILMLIACVSARSMFLLEFVMKTHQNIFLEILHYIIISFEKYEAPYYRHYLAIVLMGLHNNISYLNNIICL